LQTTIVVPSILLAAGLAGCAPIMSGVQVVKANVALSAAETAGAKNNAPYEYAAAVEYLKKAREEASYSDFAASETFAGKALTYAEDARRKALTVSAAGQPVVLPPSQPPPAAAPATP
jgi:hypothetical protein